MTTFFSELSQWFLAFGDIYFLKATLRDFTACVISYIVRLYPYVILGSFFGEFLKYTSWTKLIYRFTQKRRIMSVLFATLLGILSPLCTYGTVPVLISLYHGGVSLAPLISFLAASSMMNPQLFVMSVGGLGWDISLWRLFLVFLFALLCGLLPLKLPERFAVRESLRPDEVASARHDIEDRGRKEFTLKKYLLGVGKDLLFVSKMMAVGILIASFVDQLPMKLLFGAVDTTTPLGVLVTAIAGIPIYACGGGTIPLVSSLLEQGLSRGSALAFLTVGPATRITSLAAIATIFKKRFLLVYVLVLIAFSVAAGMLLV